MEKDIPLPESIATIVNLPDDPDLIGLLRDTAVEVRQLSRADDVLCARLNGLPRDVIDDWNQTHSMSYRQIKKIPPYRSRFDNIMASSFGWKETETPEYEETVIQVPAYNLDVQAGAIAIGGLIDTLLIRISEKTSGMGVTIKRAASDGTYGLFAAEKEAGIISPDSLLDLLSSLSSEPSDGSDNSVDDAIMSHINLLGQRYGVSQTEYRLAAQIETDEKTPADSNEGAILFVETETPRESRMSLVVERLQSFALLEAQTLTRFGAQYFNTRTSESTNMDSRQITWNGISRSAYDIDELMLPIGVTRTCKLDLPELMQIVNALQQVIASNGEYLLPETKAS